MTTSASSSSPIIVIEPRGKFALRADELWAYRELFFFLIWRDIKVRYKQTALGAAWALLQPLMLMVVFTLFLGQLAGVGPKGVPYPIFTFAALVPWTYFANALAGAANSVVGNSALVSKIYFPRILIPTAAAASYVIDLAISFVVLLVLMAGYRYTPSAQIVLVPVFALYVVVVAVGVGLLLSALNVRYRDVRYAVPFLIQFWLFATPVAYQFKGVGPQYRVHLRAQPHGCGHRRLPGVGDRGRRRPAVSSSSRRCQDRVRACRFLLLPSGRTRLRRHHLTAVVSVQGLGKQYTLGNTAGGYSRLTEELSDCVRAPVSTSARAIESRAKRRDLGAPRRHLRGRARRGRRRRSAATAPASRRCSRCCRGSPSRPRDAPIIHGRVASLLEVGTGFHPELTGRENVYLNGAILGMREREIDAKFDEIVEFAEVERFIDTPVKRYSSGMYVRLAFAVAAHLEPEILIVDEVLAVGDSAFQQKCIGKMTQVARERPNGALRQPQHGRGSGALQSRRAAGRGEDAHR